MARYDKYDPYDGGFRAPLAAAISSANAGKAYGVGLDSSGKVVLGAGNTGIRGILIAHSAKAAGDIVDVMTDGEVVEFLTTAGAAAIAGTSYTANTGNGNIDGTAASGTQIPVGFTVELTRLVVRVAR